MTKNCGCLKIRLDVDHKKRFFFFFHNSIVITENENEFEL